MAVVIELTGEPRAMAYRDYLANPKTYSHEEVWNALLGDE